jgi:hypothetical protein
MPWLERERKKGLVAEPFKVGALNQIAMLRVLLGSASKGSFVCV